MEPLLLYPDPPPPVLVQALELSGYPWKAVSTGSQAQQAEPLDGWWVGIEQERFHGRGYRRGR